MRRRDAIAVAACGGWLRAEDDSVETARKIAAVQKELPWFWSLPIEGLSEIPYTYETRRFDRRVDSSGRELESQKLVLERIALDGGSFYRCLSQNDAVPCSKSMTEALDLDSRRRSAFTSADKERVARIGAERRQNRRLFWSDFATGFRFTRPGPGRLRLEAASAKGSRRPGSELLGNVSGMLWHNESHHITRFEYKALAPLAGGTKWSEAGTQFAIELAPVENTYLPVRASMRRSKPPSRTTEESSMDFLNYRRFAVESQIKFADPP